MIIYFLSFSGQVGRKYIVGTDIITIPNDMVNMMLLWSTQPYCERKALDEKVVQMLLLCCSTSADLAVGEVKQPIMMFIKGLNDLRIIL